jgi:endonuclease G
MKKLLIALFFFSATLAQAACPELYAPPLKPEKKVTELCNIFFVVAYDENRARPLFVSERLRRGTPVGQVERINAFRQDGRVRDSPANADYEDSGFDRGHLAASGNASTLEEQRETFLLTNMTPQAPTLNRRAWRLLENKVRELFYASKTDVFVVTIPIYSKEPPLVLGTVPIPTGYWKVVIADGATRTFYADNIFMADVREYTGIRWKELIR